ncbi:deoxyuridine 5'-triphosphate nucleotidohydrolase-like [Mergus octosetaceus]
MPTFRKRQIERAELPRYNNSGGSSSRAEEYFGTDGPTVTSSNCVPSQPISDQLLQPATRGSLGLDLATTIDVTIIDQKPVKVPSTAKGPVVINNKPHGALLIGRSSSGIQGLCILPGIIDADFKGTISIVVQTLFPPLHIPAKSRIAQLILLPQLTEGMKAATDTPRKSRGFGSTGGLAMLTMAMN